MSVAIKKTNSSSLKNSGRKNPSAVYIWQHFTPRTIALINKHNLQYETNYKKLISSYERIESLSNDDSRKTELVDLWETEFNRLFKEFWKNNKDNLRKSESKISGWKDRLNLKPSSDTLEEKRKDFLSKMSYNKTENSNRRTEILNRAGYNKSLVDNDKFNFVAEAKTGKNLQNIEKILSQPSHEEAVMPSSILSEQIHTQNIDENELDNTITNENNSNPDLVNFINDDSKFMEDLKKFTIKINDRNEQTEEVNPATPEIFSQNDINAITKEEAFRENEANNQSNLNDNEFENFTQNDIMKKNESELEIDFFQSKMNTKNFEYDNKNPTIFDIQTSDSSDNGIDPKKRNILSKDGFEQHLNNDNKIVIRNDENFNLDDDSSIPYHELQPVGNYQMYYDYNKRPSMKELLENNIREEKNIDEMSEKVEFLRDLRNVRRHRVTMMRLERSNSYIIARSRRMSEARELKRFKLREEITIKTIEKADKLRRAQERQRLLELMRERQMKRTEEKRIASTLRLERQRHIERDAMYKSEIATIDSKIKHEQELIKHLEIKTKAYFTKINDERLFEQSLLKAKATPKYVALEEKAKKIENLEENKRKNRIEKISRKFIKNIK